MGPKVSVKSPVTLWKRVPSEGGWTHWEPVLECGHVYHGPFYASGSLPLELDCYRCQEVARRALEP